MTNIPMPRSRVGQLDMPASRLVFGCAIAPMLAGEDVSPLLDEVAAQGINTFDTAENYGRSEEALGRWLKGQRREDYVILTKGCHPYETSRVNPEALRRDVFQSLDRLGVDYIDIYLLHRDDPRVEVGPLMETLNDLHRQGLIREFGGSNWTCRRIDEANRYALAHELKPMTVSSPSFSIGVQAQDPWGGGVSIAGPEHAADRQWYGRQAIALFTYSALGRGFFSGRITHQTSLTQAQTLLDPFALKGYWSEANLLRLKRLEQLAEEKCCTVAQLALAWLLCQEPRMHPILSTTRKENLAAYLAALSLPLSREEAAWLNLEDPKEAF